MGKKHGPEEIIGKLREAEIVLAQGGTTGDAGHDFQKTFRQNPFRRRLEWVLNCSPATSL